MSLRRLLSEDDGAVMVEAVLVIPILLILFLGMVEFSEAFTVRRKTAAVSSTVADLVAQAASVTTADLNDIAAASAPLLAPFSTAPLSLKITSVSLDAQNNVTALWSCTWTNISTSPACTTTAVPFTQLPAGLIDQGESIIVVDTTYNYMPVVGNYLLNGVAFTSTSYYKPRLAKSVAKK